MLFSRRDTNKKMQRESESGVLYLQIGICPANLSYIVLSVKFNGKLRITMLIGGATSLNTFPSYIKG